MLHHYICSANPNFLWAKDRTETGMLACGPTNSGSFLSSAHRVNRRGIEPLSADRPIVLRDLVNLDPGDRAHGFPFDGDHGVGHFLDDVFLLLGGESVPDHVD